MENIKQAIEIAIAALNEIPNTRLKIKDYRDSYAVAAALGKVKHVADVKTPNYSYCEALADIAYYAGIKKYYGGDSRADIAKFIAWANEFEELHKETNWGVDQDYIETIEDFTIQKIKEDYGF